MIYKVVNVNTTLIHSAWTVLKLVSDELAPEPIKIL